MEKGVEIKSVKLCIGKREIDLTIDEARKLKNALDELLGKETIREVHIHDEWSWHWSPLPVHIPNYTLPDCPVFPQIWCANGTTGQMNCAGRLSLSVC